MTNIDQSGPSDAQQSPASQEKVQKNIPDAVIQEPPERIGHYVIAEKIGEGGMGLIYSAWDETLKRKVALKAIRRKYLDSNKKERLLREAQLLSKLRDERICQIHDYISSDSGDYLVLELVDGQTLDAALNKELDRRHLFPIAISITEAILHAHQKGIAHRDLKPSNIMLTSDNKIKILDFGIGTSMHRPELQRDHHTAPEAMGGSITRTGDLIGTPQFMSPEQAQGEKGVTTASDIYSLGLIFQQLFTGQCATDETLSYTEAVFHAARGESHPLGDMDPELKR